MLMILLLEKSGLRTAFLFAASAYVRKPNEDSSSPKLWYRDSSLSQRALLL